MRSSIYRCVLFSIFAAIAMGAGGCGTRTYDVTGKVTYNKKVFDKPEGTIIFLGPRGEQVQASISETDGTYRAVGVASGKNKVAVYYSNPKFKEMARTKTPPTKGGMPLPYLTPQSYASPDKSDLSVDVEKETVFDVDMNGPPIREAPTKDVKGPPAQDAKGP